MCASSEMPNGMTGIRGTPGFAKSNANGDLGCQYLGKMSKGSIQ